MNVLKSVCSLVAILAVTQVAFSEEPVHFDDANLKAAVEAELGQTDPTPGDMLVLTEFRAAGSDIIDLTGIEYAYDLEDLDLHSNDISDLSPLSGLTGLTSLNLRGNDIGDLSPLSGLTNLTRLDLDWNQISDLSPLAGLVNLTALQIELNDISDISPLAGLTNLTQMDLECNRISDIAPLAGLTGLTALELDENQISDISALSSLTALTRLYLQSNQISDLSPLSCLTDLTTLVMPGNQVADVTPLSGLTNLTWLSLSENQISSLAPLADLVGLARLYLADNQIVDISPLSDLSNLTLLSLNRNPLNADACVLYIPQIVANNPGLTLYCDACTERSTLTLSATAYGWVVDPGEGSFEYDRGTVVSIVAAAGSGSRFTGWTGTAVAAGKVANPSFADTTVTVDGDYTLQANFKLEDDPQQYELIVSASAGGSVSEPGEGVFSYGSATTISIAARAHSGYRFSRWTGTAVNAGKVADPAAASTTVVVDSSYELRATFTPLSSSALQVLAPNGGETLAAGSIFPIRWLVQGDAEIVSIELTLDEGSTWRHIALCQAAASSYDWPIPSVDSDRCLIRIASKDNAALFDTSDACFSIRKPLGRIWYVDATAAGNGDGTRWDSAFIHLQEALARVSDTDEIRVAEGLYWPDLGGGQTPGDRTATFQLPDGVTICGGFPPGGGTWEQRNPFVHRSILSGDIGVPHLASDNSYHVVTAAGAGRTSILDGLVIIAGFANGNGAYKDGAGIYNMHGSPLVRNCTFVANAAVGAGGGAYNSHSSPAFINCVFSGNTAGNCGGGVYSELGDATITNCTFTANHAIGRAGGVFDLTGTTTLANCILWGNSRLSKGSYDELAQISGDSPLAINHCCIQSWTGSLSGNDNMGQVPAFVDADGPDDVAGTPDDDVRLQAGSPCIDAGDNTAVWLETTTDLQGKPRIGHGVVDIGAYEHGEVATR